MKINARTILVPAATLLLTACAATGPRPAAGNGIYLADSYMQAVERHARNKGIDVIWINAPGRPLPEKGESGSD